LLAAACDPPDLEFEFATRSLIVEVTDINPFPYGQAEAIHRKEFPGAVVMELVGHDSIAVSQNYSHIGAEALKKACAALPEV
jgi:folate-dependent tRNA-U54 methylase TrmFO/GidA